MLQCCVRLYVVRHVRIVAKRCVLPKVCLKKQMAYRESNGHVTDNATWAWKVKLVNPMRLESDISKTAGDAI